MMKIEVDGVGVIEVSDDFKNMTKRQQQEFVNKIASERDGVEAKNKRKKDSDGYLANLARTGIGQGALLGFGDEMEAGFTTGFGLLGDYDKKVANVRGQVRDFADENPMTALAAEIGGGLATGGYGGVRLAGSALGKKLFQKAGTTGLAAGVGATEGAIAGAGAGEGLEGRLAGAAVGSTLGGALGAAAPAAIGAVKNTANRLQSGVREKAAQSTADLKAIQAFEDAKTTPQAVQQALDEQSAMGITDAMIPDVAGEATRRLARGATTIAGDGGDVATKALDSRAANLGDEIADDVGRVLGGGKTAREAEEEIIQRQQANAAKDYDIAFSKPAEEFEDSYGRTVLIDAKPRKADTAEIEDFFDMPEFDKAIKQAGKLAALKGQKIPTLAQMKSARKGQRLQFIDAEDGGLAFTNQSGKVLKAKTPEEAAALIKKFGMQSTVSYGDIDSVSTLSTFNFAKEGGFATNDGAEKMYKEALALVGDDLPPSTLTVEQMHFIKMGLDEVIDIGKRQGSIGRQLQRGILQKKSEFIDRIDAAADGNYKPANAKFAGEMALRDAIEAGENFFKETPEGLESIVKKMSDSEKEAFRIGVAQSVRNSVDNTADMADAGRKIFGNKKQRKLLRSAFPDGDTFDAFEKRMLARTEQVKTRARTSPQAGSQTALRQQDAGNLTESADAISSMLMGNPLPAARSLAGRVTDRATTSGKVGSALSRDLFNTDPAQQKAFLDRLIERQAQEQARMQRAGRNAGIYGGGVGTFSGLLTGDR